MENFRLKVFRTTAAHLNFSRAAEELLLTQPAVTQQVKALEDQLGAALFDRSGSHITLTPAGQALLPYAEKLRVLSEDALSAVNDAAGKSGGELVVGASQTIAQYLLPSLIAGFLEENPRVSIVSKSGNTDGVLDALTERKTQLALIEGPALRKDVHVDPLMEDHIVLVAPADHPWANQEIDAEELKSAPLLMREFGSGTRRVVESALIQAGLKRKDLKTKMELDSSGALLSAVEAGLGVTFVSHWAVRNQLRLGTVKIARVRGVTLSRMFGVAYRSGPEPTGNAAAFRSYLLAHSPDLTSRTPAAEAKISQRRVSEFQAERVEIERAKGLTAVAPTPYGTRRGAGGLR
jgi:LysR family transcriptional regulator, transcriptional activator of the cysJI operon